MREIIESLKRLYDNHMITENKLNDLFQNPKMKITEEEKQYILGKG